MTDKKMVVVVQRLMNDGSNRTEAQAQEMFAKYSEMALRRGSITPKEIADDIAWFAAV